MQGRQSTPSFGAPDQQQLPALGAHPPGPGFGGQWQLQQQQQQQQGPAVKPETSAPDPKLGLNGLVKGRLTTKTPAATLGHMEQRLLTQAFGGNIDFSGTTTRESATELLAAEITHRRYNSIVPKLLAKYAPKAACPRNPQKKAELAINALLDAPGT